MSREADEIARAAGIANVPDAPPPEVVEPLLKRVNVPPSTIEGDAAAPQAPGGPPDPLPASPAPATPAPTPAPTIDWQQRYNTLRGKYDAEIPDLQAQLRATQQAIQAMQAAMRAPAAPSAPPSAPPSTPAAAPAFEDIPAEDREAYGEELITKSQHWAEAKLAPRLSQLERRLIEIEGRSQQVTQNSAMSQVEAQLDRQMPQWQDINNDPEFWAWLSQPDPFSGNVRRALLTDAHARGDAARTLAFFQGFQREHTVVDPGSGTQPGQTAGNPSPVADRLPLENLAAPGRGTTSLAAPGAPALRTWNTAQVAALYREKTEGRWDGRENDFRRLEQDMIAATREGRFRN